ncbi:hypothetical protein [Parashewanella tropica]|uniref:hypothetical protein n=1 Tax=Parashewanella tropica TaxID=2547970 RepID=UPI0010598063|nr:hypothetical protein [Parashewanella tropica]
MKYLLVFICFCIPFYSINTYSEEKILYRPELGKSVLDYKAECNEHAYFSDWNEYIKKDGQLTSYSKSSLYEPKPVSKLKNFDTRFISNVDKVRSFSLRTTSKTLISTLGKPIESYTDSSNLIKEYKWSFEKRKKGLLGVLNLSDEMVVIIHMINGCISLKSISLNENVYHQIAHYQFIPIDKE